MDDYEGIPEFEPDPDHVDVNCCEHPNVVCPQSGDLR
jgi:hypothetical protein